MTYEYIESITSIAVREAFQNSAEVFCEYCGQQVSGDVVNTARNRATGDHRIPKARGGSNERANIAICCYSCNKSKDMLTEAEFRAVMSDSRALGMLRGEIRRQERPSSSRPADVRQWVEVKENRRLARLMGRLVDADSNCELCNGSGEWRRRGRVHPCQCRVLDREERGGVNASRPNRKV